MNRTNEETIKWIINHLSEYTEARILAAYYIFGVCSSPKDWYFPDFMITKQSSSMAYWWRAHSGTSKLNGWWFEQVLCLSFFIYKMWEETQILSHRVVMKSNRSLEEYLTFSTLYKCLLRKKEGKKNFYCYKMVKLPNIYRSILYITVLKQPSKIIKLLW